MEKQLAKRKLTTMNLAAGCKITLISFCKLTTDTKNTSKYKCNHNGKATCKQKTHNNESKK